MAKPKDKTIETLLKEAGFSTVTGINDRVIHATVADDKTFGKAHAAFVQTSCKHPEIAGCSRLTIATTDDILVVRCRKAVETPAVLEEKTAEPVPDNSQS